MKKNLLFLILLSSFSFSKGTIAGTELKNIADFSYEIAGTKYTSKSNEVINVVDQIIELNMACQLSKPLLVQEGEANRALPIILENSGNGRDTFNLSLESPTPTDVSNRRIYLDDGDGIFNPGDTPVNSVDIDPDGTVLLFFVSDIPNGVSWSTSLQGIKSISNTGGSGIQGTQYKLPNFWAVDGYKGGVDTSLCQYELSDLKFHLEKKSIKYSDDIYKGSKLKYEIKATVTGTGTVTNIVIEDNIPAGTSYVPNSTYLNGVLQNDSTVYLGNKISVPVSDMDINSINIVSFDVIVL